MIQNSRLSTASPRNGLLEIREGFCQISVGWMSKLCIGKMTTAAPLPELLQVKLQLFGSAARGEFDPAHSDLDFIVQMKGRREPGYAARFCDFADALEVPYRRPVDLLTELMIRYPYFKAAIAQERTVLVETAH